MGRSGFEYSLYKQRYADGLGKSIKAEAGRARVWYQEKKERFGLSTP